MNTGDVELERLREGIRKAATELEGVHQADPEIKGSGGCVVCWPDDGSWPCLSAMAVDDLRALIGDDQ